MGVYCYTRRKDMITVDGLNIVRFAYAYKQHWDSSSNRTVNRLHTMAEKATDATYDAKYAVMADGFHLAKTGALPIYEMARSGIEYCAEELNCYDEETKTWKPKIVGYLRKVGRKFIIVKEAE